jgi:hypothetical protein
MAVTKPQKCGQAGLEKLFLAGRKKLLTTPRMRPMVTMRWLSEFGWFNNSGIGSKHRIVFALSRFMTKTDQFE